MKTHETLFWKLHQKEFFMIFVGENVKAKVAQKLFGQVWGNSCKILHPRNLPASTPVMKSHLRPRCPSYERAEGERPRHASSIRRVCAYYATRTLFTRCCGMQCVTAMNINYYQRSPKTDQFMTAKISGNALKQGVEYTQCYVSAVHNCKTTRLRECFVV